MRTGTVAYSWRRDLRQARTLSAAPRRPATLRVRLTFLRSRPRTTRAGCSSNKLLGGEQTFLRLQFQPADVPARVEARVVSGPVSFEGGRRSVTTVMRNGEAILPLVAGSTPGPFTVAWSCLSCAGDPETPQEWVQEKATDCATASALTENSNNREDLEKGAQTDDELANNKDYWDKDGQPNDKKKFKDFLNAEIQRLRKILRKEGEGKAKEKTAEAIDDAFKAGKAAGLKLD